MHTWLRGKTRKICYRPAVMGISGRCQEGGSGGGGGDGPQLPLDRFGKILKKNTKMVIKNEEDEVRGLNKQRRR